MSPSAIIGILLLVAGVIFGFVVWYRLPKGGKDKVRETLGLDDRSTAIENLVALTEFANDTSNLKLLECCHEAFAHLNPLPKTVKPVSQPAPKPAEPAKASGA